MEKQQYKFSNNYLINAICLYSLIFFAIVLSRDTLVTTVTLGFYKSTFIYLIITGSFFIYAVIVNRNKIKIRKNTTKAMAIFVGLILISSAIKGDFQIYTFTIIFYICVAYFFTYIFSFEDFFRKFSNIMVFLSIFSLITCYLLRGLMFPHGVVNEGLSIVTNSAGLDLFNFGLSYVVTKPYYIRNFGLFREPGVYQFFLLMPIIYELLIEKEKMRYFNIVILSITLITTFSLVGVAGLGLVIVIYLVKLIVEKKMDKTKIKVLAAIGVSGILIFGVMYFTSTNFSTVVNESVRKLFTVNDSTYTRSKAVENNVEFFIKSPIWGNEFHAVTNTTVHNTNSGLSIFALYGIFPGVLYLIYQYMFVSKISSSVVIKVLGMVLLLIITNTQFLLGNTMFWIITFSVFMMEKQKLDFKRNDISNKTYSSFRTMKSKLKFKNKIR